MKANIKKGLLALGILWVMLLFVLFVISSLNHTEETTKHANTATETETVQPSQTPTQAPSYTLSAKQLADDYEANAVAADAKYKGKIVVVSGTIDSIGKDIMDQAYIVLDRGERILGGVRCMFAKEEEPSVARLSKGQYVSVKGVVHGGAMGASLDKCTLQ
jgi:hypothetical protein